MVRYGLLTLNVLMLTGISVFVIRGSTPGNASGAGQASGVISNPLDQLSASEIAVNVSLVTALPETVAVINHADTVAAVAAVASADTTVVAKQQAVVTDFKSATDIQKYVVQKGDTLASIAAQFNVTSDSIIWSNGLASNEVNPGDTLLIPPVDGIVYTVKEGDTVDSLASTYRANKNQIIAFNDIEISGLKVGDRIMIPGGQEPEPVVVSAPSYRAVYGYNGYDYGYCTWYVASRKSVPAGLGNASSWAYRARAMGLLVNNTPAPGAAAQTSASGLGHVAYVEVVNADGSIWISEMNSSGQVSMTDSTPTGGWGVVDWKYVPAGQARSFNYIH